MTPTPGLVCDHELTDLAVRALNERRRLDPLGVRRRVPRPPQGHVREGGVVHARLMEIHAGEGAHRLHPVEERNVGRPRSTDGALATVLVRRGVEDSERHARRERHEQLKPLRRESAPGRPVLEHWVVLGELVVGDDRVVGSNETC